MRELVELVSASEDAIEFLRFQMENNAKPSAAKDESDTETESPEKVSTGARPKSKPPLNLDAMDAADAEAAVLVKWADKLGIPYEGRVWRVKGEPKGILYGDLQPVRNIASVVTRWYREGFPDFPEAFTLEVAKVRKRNRRVWHDLDRILSARDHQPVGAEPDQMSIF